MQEIIKKKVTGILLCVQGILFEIITIINLIPLFAGLIREDYSLRYTSSDSGRAFVFTFSFWIIMAIISPIFIAVGKNMVIAALTAEKGSQPTPPMNQSAYPNSGNSPYENTESYNFQASYDDWYCGQCGHKNSHNGTVCINCGARKQ